MRAATWPLRVGLALLGLALAASPAEARRVLGADIPDPADPLQDQPHHFVLRRPWPKVLRALRRSYARAPGIVFHRVDTPPSVRAFFIENTRRGRSWDGINVYETLRDGAVYITVLPAGDDARAARGPAASPQTPEAGLALARGLRPEAPAPDPGRAP